MKKNLLLILLFIVGAISLQSCGSSEKKSGAKEKIALNVLFVGGGQEYFYSVPLTDAQKDSVIVARNASWEGLLKEYFAKVDVIMPADFSEAKAEAYDVVVMDGILPERTKEIRATFEDGSTFYRFPSRLSEEYSVPTLSIAQAGERNTRSIGSKFDWY